MSLISVLKVWAAINLAALSFHAIVGVSNVRTDRKNRGLEKAS